MDSRKRKILLPCQTNCNTCSRDPISCGFISWPFPINYALTLYFALVSPYIWTPFLQTKRMYKYTFATFVLMLSKTKAKHFHSSFKFSFHKDSAPFLFSFIPKFLDYINIYNSSVRYLWCLPVAFRMKVQAVYHDIKDCFNCNFYLWFWFLLMMCYCDLILSKMHVMDQIGAVIPL